MEGHLKGHIVQPLRIKAFGLPTDDIEWRYQMINFSVPGGETMDFFIEGVPFGEVYITGRFDVVSDTRTGFKKVVRLENMSEPWQVDFDGRGWSSGAAGDTDSAATVRLWIHGDRAGIGSPAEIDDQSRELLRKLSQEGTTVFCTTHNMEEAEALCDRMAIIDRGRIVEIDTPAQFKIKYT